MDGLPIELWQRICFSCDTPTSKTLRLVNNAFSQLAARTLFKVLYIAILEDSLEKLEKISAHPSLGLCVRELRLLSGLLNPLYFPYYSWQRSIDLREPRCRWSMKEKPPGAANEEPDAWHSTPRFILEEMAANAKLPAGVEVCRVTEERLSYHHNRFREYYDGQRRLMNDNRDLSSIAFAIRRLPGLRAVEAYDNACIEGCVLDAIRGTEKKPIPIISRLRRDFLLKQPFLDITDIRHMSGRDEPRPVTCLLYALSQTPMLSGVRSFKMGAMPWSIWDNVNTDSHQLDIQNGIKLVVQNLRTLKVTLQFGDLGSEYHDESSLSRIFTNSLVAATQLERVTMSTWKPHVEQGNSTPLLPWEPDLMDITEVFQTITWPKLRYFKIGACATRGKAFAAFLKRHSCTMKSFKVKEVYLMPSSENDPKVLNTWRSVFTEVAPTLSLDRVRIDSVVDSDIVKSASTEDTDLIWSKWEHRWYNLGITQYLQTNGKSQYPVWGQNIDQSLKVSTPIHLLPSLSESTAIFE